MGGSLTISGFPYDLLDPTSPIRLATGSDRGSAVPTLSQVQSDYLDGGAVTGLGSSNRSLALPVALFMTRADGADQLAALLQTAVTQQVWQLTLTPQGGFPVIYDCARSTVVVSTPLQLENQGYQQFTVTCAAQPFGRSQTVQTVALTGPASALLDSLDTAPTVTSATTGMTESTTVDTTNKTQGTGSAKVVFTPPSTKHPGFGGSYSTDGQVTLSRTFGTAVTPPDGASVLVDVSAVAATGAAVPLNMTLTLTGASGATYAYMPTTGRPSTTASVGFTTVTLSSTSPCDEPVAGYALTVGVVTLAGPTPGQLTVNADNLRSVLAGQSISDGQGGTYQIANVLGTARTPAALLLTASSPFSSFIVHRPPQMTPITGIPSTSEAMVPLNGTSGVSYTVAGRYEGTYDIYLSVLPTSASGARTYTVTIAQGGQGIALTVTVTPTPSVAQYVHLIPSTGPLSLPVLNYPPDASSPTTFTVTSTVTGDTIQDLLLLDTAGQSIVAMGFTAAENVWIDAPTVAQSDGNIYAGSSRAAALSIEPQVTGLAGPGPALINPGANAITAHCPTEDLNLTLTYAPRWLQSAAA
jgi:hypothetical protein